MGNCYKPYKSSKKSAITLALRPEHLIVESNRLSECDVQSSADILRVEDHGSEILIHLTLVGFTHKIFVSRIPSHGHHVAFKQGERIYAGFKLDTALFFDTQGVRLD